MLADKILHFLQELRLKFELPPGVEVMYPFANADTMEACTRFYHKFYNDDLPRYCIIGINPGRFGGGVTGIPFTDPIRLSTACGIQNKWPPKQELSSVFIYDMIAAFGGPQAFYSNLYFTSISPLGFTSSGKNLNYYDNKLLMERIEEFAVATFREQLAWGLKSDIAFCLGEGVNFRFLTKLNAAHKLFERIIPLSHPRFIMQYRLKKKQEYIDTYLRAFSEIDQW